MEELNKDVPEILIKKLRKIRLIFIIFIMLVPLIYMPNLKMGLDVDIKGVRFGKIRCIFPKEFVQGKTYRIQAIVSYRRIKTTVIKNEQDQISKIDSIKVGEVMKIELIDVSNTQASNFTIKAIGNIEQALDTSDYISGNWEWQITPNKPGWFELGIKSSVLVSTNQGAKYIDYPIIIEKIFVKSSILYKITTFLKDYWILLFIASCIITWIYYYWKTKSKLKEKYSSITVKELKEFDESISNLIQIGDIESALNMSETLLQKSNSGLLLNNIILLKSNYSQYKSSFTMNLIDYTEYIRNQTRTAKGLLDLKNDLKTIITVIN